MRDTLEYLRGWDVAAGKGLSAESRRIYRYWCLRFLATQLTPIPRVGKAHVDAFLTPFNPAAQNQARAALTHFFGYLEREGEIDESPVEQEWAPVPVRRVPLAYSEEELSRILFTAAQWSTHRAYAFLGQYLTGARAGEWCNLDARDVHLQAEEAHVVFRNAKGRKDRAVPLDALGVEVLGSMRRRGRVVGVGRGTYWSWFRKACELAHIERRKAHPHCLRHTFATDLRRRGVDLEVIRVLLGHESLKTTQIYEWVADEERRLAVGRLSRPWRPLALDAGPPAS